MFAISYDFEISMKEVRRAFLLRRNMSIVMEQADIMCIW